MLLRYAVLAATAIAVAGIAEAQAQSPFPPAGAEVSAAPAARPSPFPPVGGQQASPFPPAGGQQSSPFPAAGGSSPFPQIGAPQPQQAQRPPCLDKFLPLREEVDKRFESTKAGVAKKASAAEMCSLLTKFTQAEVALIKFVEKNNDGSCPFPPGMLDNIKAGNAKSDGYRKQACTAAARPAGPARAAEPTLSDAFGAPALNKDTTRTGKGTFDSLGGNPLAR